MVMLPLMFGNKIRTKVLAPRTGQPHGLLVPNMWLHPEEETMVSGGCLLPGELVWTDKDQFLLRPS